MVTLEGYPSFTRPIVPISEFFKIAMGLDLFSHVAKSKIKNQWIIKLWRLIFFLANLLSGVYVFSQLAVPTLISSFMASVKGVRSQMSSFAAFLDHTNLSIIGLLIHFLLILTMPRTIDQMLTTLSPVRLPSDSTNKLAKLRRFSIATIIYIISGVDIKII